MAKAPDTRIAHGPLHHGREPEGRTILDRGGHQVDVSGSIWRLASPTRPLNLNWDEVIIPNPAVLATIKAYFRNLIQNFSIGEVVGNWYALRLVWSAPSFETACASGGDIPYRVISEVRQALGAHEQYRLHYVRKWYNWCCDQGFDSFSAEVAFEINQLVIGGNQKGEAVQSADPEDGPLIDLEIVALNNALRASKLTGSLSLAERCLLWLCIALGSNASPLALLREEDLEKVDAEGVEGVIYQLRVPRHKKRDATPRAQFKTRKLNSQIGEAVEALIAQNRADAPGDDGYGRPLFRRQGPRTDLPANGPLSEYRHHLVANDVTRLVGEAVRKLGVLSPRTGCPLNVTVRRLRYTFATRLVREGASQRVVAEALDHTDLQNVRVYFDLKSDIVERLDAAMALELGPLSQAFLGHIVRSEEDAVRGDRKSGRIYHADRTSHSLEALGTCGSFSFCGLTAPLACYTCVKFQPWMDAPHDKALGGLLAERQRRLDEGRDARMVTLLDNTILAVADVIKRIEGVRRSQPDVG
jgi:integrase